MRRGFLILILILNVTLCKAQDTTRLTLLFAGDIMQHDSNIAAAWDSDIKKYNYQPCFQFIAPEIAKADLAIGNLELTLGGKPFKGYPQFSAPDELAIELRNIGFDVLVTANNHCVDRGRRGLERTLTVLDSLQILHTGTFKDSAEYSLRNPLWLEKNGFRLALLNYTYGTNGLPVSRPNIVNHIDTLSISRDIAKAKSLSPDAIIVFFHWGSEYQSSPNEFQKKMAALCFRKGAMMVIGSHPHVLQPVEWRKEENQLVAYSLGNFISGQRPRYRDGGMALNVVIEKVTKDSTSATHIVNAGYKLEWVHKTSSGKFYNIPLPDFENDTTVVTDAESRKALKLFASDSRSLLNAKNLNVAEESSWATDSCTELTLIDFAGESGKSILDFYGFSSTGEHLWVANFPDADMAIEVANDLKQRFNLQQYEIKPCRLQKK